MMEPSLCQMDMNPFDLDLDWQHWFERWETMQNCYVPQRVYRFDLMLSLANLPREDKVKILDLGCGPGSLTFRALWHYPNAHIVAVDFAPVMLAMGQNVVSGEAGRVQFVLADIRQADWWEPYEGTFDLVMSATALHWLSAENLAQVYRHIYEALKPGGWLLNSDHVASDDPEMQARYRRILAEKQQAAFGATGADNWDGFWQSLRHELKQLDLHETELWEGTDDGLPRQFHIEALQAYGFEQVAVHWQDLGEAVVGARKMMSE